MSVAEQNLLAAERLLVPVAAERVGPALRALGERLLARVEAVGSWTDARALAPSASDEELAPLAEALHEGIVRGAMVGAVLAQAEADARARTRLDAADDEAVLLETTPPGRGVHGFATRPFREAIDLFAARRVLPPERFYALDRASRERAFTVSRLAEEAQLDVVRDSLEAALEEGWDLEHWREDVAARFADAGWLGDEPEGWHAETVFRTNVMSAYALGRREQMEQVKSFRPYWRVFGIDDHRTRPTHAAVQGVILDADDPIWDEKYPPFGYNCRCGVESLSERDLERHGWEVGEPEDLDGVPDEGWEGGDAMLSALAEPLLLAALADWNEEDHPRDERGRFAPSGEGGGAGAPEPAPKGRLPVPYRREMWAPEVQPTKTKEEAARWARRLFSAHLHPGAPDEARVSALVQNDEMELALAQHRAELKGPGAGAQDARRTLWRHRDSDMGPSLLAASFGRDSLSEDEHAAAREEWGKAVAEWFEKREPTALELRNLAADVWEKNRNRIRAYLPAWGDTGEAWEAINFERRGYPPSEKERAMVGRVEAAMVEAAEQEDVRHVGRLAEQEYPKLRDDPGAPPLGSDAFVDALEKRIHDAFVETRGREPPALVAGGQAYWVTEHYGVSAVTFEKGTGWRRVGAMTPNAFDAVQGVAQHPVIAEVLERAPLTGGIEVRTLFADAGGVYDHMEGRILVSVSTLPEVARGLPTADSYVGDEPWTVGVHWSSANRSQPGGMHSVVIHELGHHVFAALRNKAGFEKTPETEAASRLFEAHNKPGTRLSVYSATNEGEFEAEAFAAYIEDPEDLAKRFPDIHAWVRTSLVKLGVTNPDARPKPRQWEFLSLSAEADAPAPQGEPVDVEAWLDLWAELRELAAERPLTEEDLLAFRDDEEALGVFDHEALATFASSLGIALHAVTLADWDEDAHPRDERGRFTSGGAGLRQPLEHQGNDLPGPPLLDPDMVRQAWWPPGADPPGRNGEPPGNNGRPWGSGPRDQPVPPLEARAERWRNRPLIERLSDPRRREVPEGWDPSSAPRLWSEFDRNAAMGERVAHEGQSARRAMDMLEERRRQERIRATMDQAAANIAAEPDRASAVLAEYGRLNAAIRTPAIREEVARIFEQRFPLAGKDFDTPTWRNRFRKWMGSSTFGYRATDEDVVRGAMGPGSSVMNQVTGQRYPFTIDADLRRVIQEAREAELRERRINSVVARLAVGHELLERLHPTDLRNVVVDDKPVTPEEMEAAAQLVDMTDRARRFADAHGALVESAANILGVDEDVLAGQLEKAAYWSIRSQTPASWTDAEVRAILVRGGEVAADRRLARRREAARAEAQARDAARAEAVRAKRAAVLAQGITATNDEGEAASAIAQGWGTIHYHAVVDSASKYGEFAVKLYDEGGQQVSRRYERTVERDGDGIHVKHDYFELADFARDKGIGEEVLRRSFQVYEAENVADVSVTAGLSTGPYTWADFGFDWDDETNEEMRKSFARWLRFHSNMSSEQIGEATAEIRHSWHLADFGLSGQHGAPISVSDKLDGTHLGKAFLLSVRPMWEGRVDMTPSSESYKRMRWRLFGEGRRYDDQGIKRATPKRASPTTLSASEPWWADPYWASFLPPGMKQADPGEDDLDALLDLEDLGL